MQNQSLFGIIVVALRAATLVFQSLVVGGIVFHRWIAGDSTAPRGERSPGILLLRVSAAGLVGTQLLYIGINSAVLMDSLGIGLSSVASANFFVAGAVTIIAAVAIAVTPSSKLARPGSGTMLLALVVMVCGVLGSHAISRMEDRIVLTAFTAVHQCATAVWIGGLPQLWLALRGTSAEKAEVGQRFSRFALWSVVALLGSGLAMAFRYIDSPKAIYGTSYGIMLAVKVVFFAVLLAIGACNRLLVRSPDRARAKLLLRRLLEAEIGIGITAILAAASLTSQPPAVDLKLGRVTAQEIYQRLRPTWPRLESPGLAAVSASTLQATKAAEQAGLPPPPAHPNTPGDIAWSEYNHHWAGIFVLLIGLLAMLAQARGRVRWWPLMLIALAAFIFLRADPEGWPLGPNSFWESIHQGEVLQHKLYALLVVLFAIFEFRVQLGKAGKYAAYVFPVVCALGGALVLTHSHSLDNIKEQMLAELSHAPIAIAGVLAGWSRWLQLRLPESDGGLVSRIWPVCFAVIGAVLLNYREA
ncbi:MAG TPA: CopD family protein [Candidatus Angelobacter sp.]|nr:CopD family protein [Candidatus Angelobacter sp.]